MAWWKWVCSHRILGLEFWSHDELLYSVQYHGVAELGIPEFCAADPSLLLLDPSATLQGQLDGPFYVFVGNFCLPVWVQKFQQTVRGPVHGCGVPSAQCAAELYVALEERQPAL